VKRKFLVVTFEVTGWTDAEIASLAFAASVQGESDDDEESGHPEAVVTTTVNEEHS
jgi:hypothetical protein